MLVLSRQRDEKIALVDRDTGEVIEIQLVDVRKNRIARLGIDAGGRWMIQRRRPDGRLEPGSEGNSKDETRNLESINQ